MSSHRGRARLSDCFDFLLGSNQYSAGCKKFSPVLDAPHLHDFYEINKACQRAQITMIRIMVKGNVSYLTSVVKQAKTAFLNGLTVWKSPIVGIERTTFRSESAALTTCTVVPHTGADCARYWISWQIWFWLKGALSRYSVILCRFFCGRKWRPGDSRRRRRPTRSSFFLHQCWASQSIDVGVSVSYPCKVIPLSDEDGLWDKIKKVKTKRQVCPWKMGKIHGNQNRAPQIDLELSWSEDRSRLARLSGAVAYISLHSTMYTTIIDRQYTCWARFAWKDARPPLFFPTTK